MNNDQILYEKAISLNEKLDTSQRQTLRYKIKVFFHYCKGMPKCQCCGERGLFFLTLDHINGHGKQHREKVGFGNTFLNWIIKNDFPPGYQVLYNNCNIAKGRRKQCPHQYLPELI